MGNINDVHNYKQQQLIHIYKQMAVVEWSACGHCEPVDLGSNLSKYADFSTMAKWWKGTHMLPKFSIDP